MSTCVEFNIFHIVLVVRKCWLPQDICLLGRIFVWIWRATFSLQCPSTARPCKKTSVWPLTSALTAAGPTRGKHGCLLRWVSKLHRHISTKVLSSCRIFFVTVHFITSAVFVRKEKLVPSFSKPKLLFPENCETFGEYIHTCGREKWRTFMDTTKMYTKVYIIETKRDRY